MKHAVPFRAFLILACAAALWCAAPASRADDPVEDFPPPAEGGEPAPAPEADAPPAPPPAAQPAPTPPAPTAPAPKDAWSAPAVTGARTGALPPPQIVRRRGGMPPRATPPAPGPTATPRSEALPPAAPTPTVGDGPVVDVPAARPTLPPLPATREEAARVGTPSAPAFSAAPGVGGRIWSIAKAHNVELPALAPAEDGAEVPVHELALRLDVDYEVRGQAGRDVYVAIWFARVDSGALLASGLQEYRDTDGHVTLQTRSARVASDAARYVATLQIPYRAFPVASGEDAYDVEARVQVLRQESDGRVSVLCKGSTTFRVFGYPDEGANAAR